MPGARGRDRACAVGDRVFLRTPTAGDAAEFTSLMRRSRRLHHPWLQAPTTAAAYAAYLARGRQRSRKLLLVCMLADGAIAGVINLNEIVRGRLQSAYLGYAAGVPFAGQGYMTEGLGLALGHAFTRMGLHRLEANIQPENRASIALARRLGFRLEGFSPRYLKLGGRWRDHQRWAIVREEWRAHRRAAPRAGSRPDRRGPPRTERGGAPA